MMQINNGLGIFYVKSSYIVLTCKICIICHNWLYINNTPPFFCVYVKYVLIKIGKTQLYFILLHRENQQP